MLKKVKSYKSADDNNRAEYVCSVVCFLCDTLFQLCSAVVTHCSLFIVEVGRSIPGSFLVVYSRMVYRFFFIFM
jgi:hypothetical protein